MQSSRSIPRSNRYSVWMCALALLTVGLLAPSTAKAAHCGRYVEAQAKFEAQLASLVAGDISAEGWITSGTPIRPEPPCKGAFCSAPTPAQPAAPVTPVSVPGQDGLCLMGRASIPPAHSSLLPAQDDEIRPILAGLSIFHPPRQVCIAA